MADEVLLTSEAFVKGVSSISDNTAAKYLKPSIREAQDIGLQRVLGETLTDKLKALVGDGSIKDEGNAKYKALLDRCQYYLAYQTIMELIPKVAYKVGNIGVAKTSDENVQGADWDEVAQMGDWYQGKADSCCYDLQRWLLERHSDYPELSESCYLRIRSNLYSAATSGVWMGGQRGSGRPRRKWDER